MDSEYELGNEVEEYLKKNQLFVEEYQQIDKNQYLLLVSRGRKKKYERGDVFFQQNIWVENGEIQKKESTTMQYVGETDLDWRMTSKENNKKYDRNLSEKYVKYFQERIPFLKIKAVGYYLSPMTYDRNRILHTEQGAHILIEDENKINVWRIMRW